MFASIFRPTRSDSGKRREIDLVEGFRLGNTARFAFYQSRNSVES